MAEQRQGAERQSKKQEREIPGEKRKENWAKEYISDQLFSCLQMLYKAVLTLAASHLHFPMQINSAIPTKDSASFLFVLQSMFLSEGE